MVNFQLSESRVTIHFSSLSLIYATKESSKIYFSLKFYYHLIYKIVSNTYRLQFFPQNKGESNYKSLFIRI